MLDVTRRSTDRGRIGPNEPLIADGDELPCLVDREPNVANVQERSTSASRRNTMRYVHIAIIVLLTLLILSFKIQNLQTATVQFFSFSMTMPVTVLIVLVYVLGMLTGWSLWSLLKRSYKGGFSQK